MSQSSGTVTDFIGVYFTDGNTGIVVGDSGAIFHTTDGGTTWKIQSSGPAELFSAVSFTDAYTGTAVGPYGMILRTTTGGLTWIGSDTKQDVPWQFTLSQNSPNPFNPATTIRYRLPGRAHVTLIVFNTLGQQVSTLVNDSEDAGDHEVRFDGANFSSGVSFYRLLAGSYVETKRLLLLK